MNSLLVDRPVHFRNDLAYAVGLYDFGSQSIPSTIDLFKVDACNANALQRQRCKPQANITSSAEFDHPAHASMVIQPKSALVPCLGVVGKQRHVGLPITKCRDTATCRLDQEVGLLSHMFAALARALDLKPGNKSEAIRRYFA